MGTFIKVWVWVGVTENGWGRDVWQTTGREIEIEMSNGPALCLYYKVEEFPNIKLFWNKWVPLNIKGN